MPTDRPDFPYHDFEAAEASHRTALDAFAAEYGRETPDRERLASHAQSVREVPGFVAPFERWWMSPRVQAFIAELTATGI